MSYIPKTIKCKINSKNITDEEMTKHCFSESEKEAVREFYKKIDGAILILSLWRYDNYESYHVSGWEDSQDKQMMEAIFELEKEFGAYNDYEEFKKDWKAKEYDPGCAMTFPKCVIEELEIMCEESNELSKREKLNLINSMEIIEDSASCGGVEYILVEDSENNRNVLHEIGFDNAYIKDNCHPEEGYLDITTIGFKYAQYYDMKKKCFYNEDYLGSPITAKTLED